MENKKQAQKKFLIITDSSSDITQEMAKKLGIIILPLEVSFKGENKVYKDGVDLSFEEFYQKLKLAKESPKTAQVPFGVLSDAINDNVKNTEILFIMISSGMSGTFNTLKLALDDVDESLRKKVHCFDSETVTGEMAALVFEAIKMRDNGLTAAEANKELEKLRERIQLYANVEDLKYLKMGGRIRPSAAIIGGLLNIKPLITIKNKMVENIGKEFGQQKAYNKMIDLMVKDGIDLSMPVYSVASGDLNLAKNFADLIKSKTEVKEVNLHNIGCTVGTHIGPNCVGVVFFKKQ